MPWETQPLAISATDRARAHWRATLETDEGLQVLWSRAPLDRGRASALPLSGADVSYTTEGWLRQTA